jgi:hypothetical protein
MGDEVLLCIDGNERRVVVVEDRCLLGVDGRQIAEDLERIHAT